MFARFYGIGGLIVSRTAESVVCCISLIVDSRGINVTTIKSILVYKRLTVRIWWRHQVAGVALISSIVKWKESNRLLVINLINSVIDELGGRPASDSVSPGIYYAASGS